MILKRKIRQQQKEVALRYLQTQNALQQRQAPRVAQPETLTQTPFAAGASFNKRHPMKLLAWSFVIGSVAACIGTRKKKETTADAMAKITRALKTGVAAVALAKTMGDLTGEAVSIAQQTDSQRKNHGSGEPPATLG